MIKETNNTEKLCDLCGNKVERFSSCTEGAPQKIYLIEERYRGDFFHFDICQECNSKLLNILEVRFPCMLIGTRAEVNIEREDGYK